MKFAGNSGFCAAILFMPVLHRLRERTKNPMLPVLGRKEFAMSVVRGMVLAGLLAASGATSTSTYAADSAATVAPAPSRRVVVTEGNGVVVAPAPGAVVVGAPSVVAL